MAQYLGSQIIDKDGVLGDLGLSAISDEKPIRYIQVSNSIPASEIVSFESDEGSTRIRYFNNHVIEVNVPINSFLAVMRSAHHLVTYLQDS
jgi:hypothetical protein